MAKLPKPEELLSISYEPPKGNWMDTPAELKDGL